MKKITIERGGYIQRDSSVKRKEDKEERTIAIDNSFLFLST